MSGAEALGLAQAHAIEGQMHTFSHSRRGFLKTVAVSTGAIPLLFDYV